VAMFPHERSLVKRLEGKPFALIGINSDDNKEFVKKQNEKQQVSWRSFWCGQEGTGGPIPTKWNVSSWPTLYFIDRKGVIRHKNVRDEKEMDKVLDEMVAAAEKDGQGKQ